MKKHFLIGLIIAVSLLFLLTVSPAQAAIGTGGATCTASNKTTTGITGIALTCTVATQNLEAGNIAILWFAGDNTALVDGNAGLLSSVTDSAGNSWTVQRCFTNTIAGAAADGATTCIAWSKLTTALNIGATITANFSSITAKAIVVKEFTVGAGNTLSVVATATDLPRDNTTPGSMAIAGLTNTEHLFVRSTALERAVPASLNWTVTVGYTTSGCNGTTGGGGATNMTTCGEFRVLTATTSTSNPSIGSNDDDASIFIAFDEVTPLVPAKLAFSVQPSDTTAGVAITPAVTVQIQDALGTLVTTATNAVTIAIGTNPSGGTLSGTLTVNAVAGVATFSDLSINNGGNGYTLTATSGILTGATSNAFNIRGPSKLAFLQQPGNTIYNQTISPAVTVQIQDSLGNLVPIATNTVAIAIGTNPSGGTLSGTLSVSAVAGVATFSNLSINNVGNGYTLTASSAGLTDATSNAFNITTGAYGLTQCAGSRYGGDLGCTANDVQITNIAVVGGLGSCEGGSTITVNLSITVNSGSPDRYDVGVFISNDGTDPQLASAASCTVGILPTDDPPFRNTDPGPWSGTLDTCGDVNGTMNPGGLGGVPQGSGTFTMTNVNILCQSLTGSGGNLYIPFVVSWDQQSSPSGATCTSIANPVPGTVSKCNAPLIAQGTVNVVVLPTITKTDNKTTLSPGETTTYTVVISNTTGTTLTNAIFKDPAVADLTNYSVICTPAGGATCPGSVTVGGMQGAGLTILSIPANTAQPITGITKANPAVVTYSGADTYSNGDKVKISGVLGMTEVNDREFTVANVNTAANTFELSGINSTGYTAYTSGGTVMEISSVTFSITATVINNPSAAITNTATVTVADPAATPVADRTVSASDTTGGSGNSGSGSGSGSGSSSSRIRVIKWREVFQ
jgi:uncharacterized repeat protein (TIGR01451 family)